MPEQGGMQGATSGRTSALAMSTLAFTVCFAVWTIFSIIGVQIKKDLGLTDTQFGLLVGTPILTGSLIRLILGIWADQHGGRVVYTGVMVAAAVATWLLTYAYDYPTFLIAALGSASPAAPSPSASPMSRAGTRPIARARRSASSAPAMSGRRSPSSSRPSSWWHGAGRAWPRSGPGRCW